MHVGSPVAGGMSAVTTRNRDQDRLFKEGGLHVSWSDDTESDVRLPVEKPIDPGVNESWRLSVFSRPYPGRKVAGDSGLTNAPPHDANPRAGRTSESQSERSSPQNKILADRLLRWAGNSLSGKRNLGVLEFAVANPGDMLPWSSLGDFTAGVNNDNGATR